MNSNLNFFIFGNPTASYAAKIIWTFLSKNTYAKTHFLRFYDLVIKFA